METPKQQVKKANVMLVTTSRAEFGLFYWLIKGLVDSADFSFKLVVTGSHLLPELGMTIEEIRAEGIEIAESVEIMMGGASKASKAKSSALGMLSFTDVFSRHSPDIVIVMGDRYELLGIVSAAALMSIPVAHFSGGEITQGVIDDVVRHTITKLAHLHFVSNIAHAKRVEQLGEEPCRIFNVGEPGIEHIKKTELMDLEELSESLDFILEKPFAIFTFHPVEFDNGLNPKQQLTVILDALEDITELTYLITYPNFDFGGEELIGLLKSFEAKNSARVKVVPSLGFRRYLSALKYCQVVLGNSSSGLVEAPCFGKATLNIGSRQDGRVRGDNVIDCEVDREELKAKLRFAISSEFQKVAEAAVNPYGNGNTVEKVLDILGNIEFPITGVKRFFDIER